MVFDTLFQAGKEKMCDILDKCDYHIKKGKKSKYTDMFNSLSKE